MIILLPHSFPEEQIHSNVGPKGSLRKWRQHEWLAQVDCYWLMVI